MHELGITKSAAGLDELANLHHKLVDGRVTASKAQKSSSACRKLNPGVSVVESA
jgi:hypothetical protein